MQKHKKSLVTADVTYTAQWKRIYRPTPSTPTV